MGVVARGGPGVEIGIHVAHAVGIVDGHFGVQPRALDQFGEFVAAAVTAVSVAEEVDVVVAGEVVVLHAVAEGDAPGGLDLLVDGVHGVGESQRVGQLHGVEIDEFLLIAFHVVVLVDRFIAGGVAEFFSAEVVDVVVGVGQSVLELEGGREAVVVLCHHVRAVVQHEV